MPIRPSIQRGPSGGAAAEGSGSKSAGAAKESNKKVAKHTLGSEALREIGDEYAVEIEREEAHLQARAHQTLQVRLGGTLLTLLSKKESSSKDSFKDPTKSQIREIVNSWANPKSGEVSKMDFRKHVRKFVDEPDIKKVDALFGSLDADGGACAPLPMPPHASLASPPPRGTRVAQPCTDPSSLAPDRRLALYHCPFPYSIQVAPSTRTS